MDIKNLPQYDSMSTEKLEQLLYVDSSLPERMGLDRDTYFYICRLLAERKEMAKLEEEK